MKIKTFRILIGTFCLAILGFSTSRLYAQVEATIQVRTFDQQLQVLPGIDISIDGQTFFTMGEMGSAIVGIGDLTMPPDEILIGDSTLEAESWNYSKGILEIIIRQRTTQNISVLVKDQNNQPVSNLTVLFREEESITVVTDGEGYFQMVVPIELDLNTTELFSMEGYTLSNKQFIGSKGEFTVEKIPVVVTPVIRPKVVQEPVDEGIDLSSLDSLTSLSEFYAVIHNLDMNGLDASEKDKIDAKFRELMGLMTDSLNMESGIFLSDLITDTTQVQDDLAHLIEQAQIEENRIDETRDKFTQNFNTIVDKMADGGQNLNDDERAEMLLELDRLGKILAENERKFFEDQAGFADMLNRLKNNLLNIQELEDKLSISEQQRLEEQQKFQKQLLIALLIVTGFVLLTILLVYLVRKFRRQKIELSIANERVKLVNENLEGLVAEKTYSLERTNKELDTFLYKSSHDLKRPLTTIIGLYNVAKITLEEKALMLFEKAYETAYNMDKMLQKLLMVSYINQPSDVEKIDFEKEIETARQEFEESINEDETNFEFTISPEVEFNSHQNLVYIIIRNLLENALDYSKLNFNTQSKVVIKVEQDDELTVIKVLDNGPGIKEDIHDKIWEMFYVGNTNSKGNGLGLYIVKKAVDVLGGEIDVVSSLGEFTEFSVALPSMDFDDESVESSTVESEELSPVS